jgi:formylglycine-generating enzyme
MENPQVKGLEEKDNILIPPFQTMVWIPGGTFTMGSHRHYPEEGPAHQVTVKGFWMDKFTVTNRDFKLFTESTGYVTFAERPLNPGDYPGAAPESLVPGSLVFIRPAHKVELRNIGNWWAYVPGACWKYPEGPGSSVDSKWDHPVVHVAWEDVEAYAKWKGKELPTEAEWEFACRGGLEGKIYEWGDDLLPEGRIMANFWTGEFPWKKIPVHIYKRTSPAGAFPPNAFGLHDMTGNVWEWTQDWYEPEHHHDAATACCIPVNPRGGQRENSFDSRQPEIMIPGKVLKGGSHLCAQNYCYRYRPAARHAQMIDSGTGHIGFRCIVRVEK